MLWPRRADCAQEFPSIPPAHLLPTFYLPPETQGVRSAFHVYRETLVFNVWHGVVFAAHVVNVDLHVFT